MKYFRVNIPKRYRSEDHAKYLMEIAMTIKLKRLHKYEKEWANIKAAERAREDPVVRLERENKKLLSDNMRLDTENDNLARQLVTSKVIQINTGRSKRGEKLKPCPSCRLRCEKT